MINKLLTKNTNSLIEVMKIINENAMGVAFVVDNNNKLCGIVTDGDIRRALLNDIGLDANISQIMSKEYSFGLITESKNELIKKISHKIKILPLVDKDHIIKDYFEYNQNNYFPVAIPHFSGNEFKYLTDAFLSTWISSSGEYIDKFEHSFSSYSDCKHGVCVSNGTVALHLALVTLGIKEGDEVIIPNLTFAATINTVLHANATPVIVDIDKESWNIDPHKIEAAITSKTKAIIPVHLYGYPCDMDPIMDIASKHNLYVIEDCAEAHGATYNGKKVGSFGDIGCFSFFGNKVITTGEGGMCVTNNNDLDEKMRVLRDHGMDKNKKYHHDVVGYNYRMTNLQAAIGLAQLERIDKIHNNRRKFENTYKEILNNTLFKFQKDTPKTNRITWLVSILLNDSINRDEFMDSLKSKGIDARPFFYPLSSMKIYEKYAKTAMPVSDAVSNKELTCLHMKICKIF